MYFDLQYRCLFRIFISPYVWTKCKEDIVPAAHFKCSKPKQQQQKIIIYFYPLGSSDFFLADFKGKLLNQASSCPYTYEYFSEDTILSYLKDLNKVEKEWKYFFCYSLIIQQQYSEILYGGDPGHCARY